MPPRPNQTTWLGARATTTFSWGKWDAKSRANSPPFEPPKTLGVARGRHLMHADEVTIAEILREAGYRTGIFGKWHLGDNYPMRPTDQGFEEALVHKGGGIGQAAGPPGNTYFDPILEHNNVSKKFSGYCDDYVRLPSLRASSSMATHSSR